MQRSYLTTQRQNAAQRMAAAIDSNLCPTKLWMVKGILSNVNNFPDLSSYYWVELPSEHEAFALFDDLRHEVMAEEMHHRGFTLATDLRELAPEYVRHLNNPANLLQVLKFVKWAKSVLNPWNQARSIPIDAILDIFAALQIQTQLVSTQLNTFRALYSTRLFWQAKFQGRSGLIAHLFSFLDILPITEKAPPICKTDIPQTFCTPYLNPGLRGPPLPRIPQGNLYQQVCHISENGATTWILDVKPSRKRSRAVFVTVEEGGRKKKKLDHIITEFPSPRRED